MLSQVYFTEIQYLLSKHLRFLFMESGDASLLFEEALYCSAHYFYPGHTSEDYSDIQFSVSGRALL
jgi:hypothetical protein